VACLYKLGMPITDEKRWRRGRRNFVLTTARPGGGSFRYFIGILDAVAAINLQRFFFD